MKLQKDPNDKYSEYKVDFHGNESHEGEEVKASDGKINDWHERHRDKIIDAFCDSHPDAPHCRVYDD